MYLDYAERQVKLGKNYFNERMERKIRSILKNK